MIHELREYRLTAANWLVYRRLFAEVAVPIRGNSFGQLLGAWTVDDQDLTSQGLVGFAHVWSYESLDSRAALRAQLGSITDWTQDFLMPAKELIDSQALSVLHPQGNFDWPILSSTDLAELRRYCCAVGEATHALTDFKQRRLPCWSTEFPDPNSVACYVTPNEGAFLDAAAERLPHIKSVRITKLRRLDLTGH